MDFLWEKFNYGCGPLHSICVMVIDFMFHADLQWTLLQTVVIVVVVMLYSAWLLLLLLLLLLVVTQSMRDGEDFLTATTQPSSLVFQ